MSRSKPSAAIAAEGAATSSTIRAQSYASLLREAQRASDEAAALRAENERLRSVMLCATSHEIIFARLDKTLRRMERAVSHPEALAAWRGWLAERRQALLGGPAEGKARS